MILCVLLFVLQTLIDSMQQKQQRPQKNECSGCVCANDRRIGAQCPDSEKLCGPQYLELGEVYTCPIPDPPEWPPLLQLPLNKDRAVGTGFVPFEDLPNESCRENDTCPVAMLFTGNNQSFAEGVYIYIYIYIYSNSITYFYL